MSLPLGLTEKNIKKIVSDLSIVLGSTYALYVKTQGFHWNVVDPRFYALHKLFEEQYEDLAEALDTIAERIRMLGHNSPGSLKSMLNLSVIKETEKVPAGKEMIQILAKDHEEMIRKLRPLISAFVDLHDDGSSDMLIARIRAHEKAAWMLRSHL